MPRSRAKRSVLGVAFAGAAMTLGCLRDESAPREQARRELVWDFVGPRLPMARLWPTTSTTPERLKRALATEHDRGRLFARVDGKDPYFVWRLENAISVSLVSVDVESSQSGVLQLFWSSSACPTFRESCSVSERLSSGRQWVDFLVDRATPVRELRLDLPESTGSVFWFSEIAIFERAELSPRWIASAGAELVPGPNGLDMTSRSKDPWMTVTTPGLDATRFDEVELALHGTGTIAPQLFWDGPCGHYDEACSIRLAPADAGTLTHKARLSRAATWRGAIGTLRFDPGDGPGEYTVDRIALTGPGQNAQRARR
jgi:hypothetical protein